jgi:retron-type reverse transcriptase
MWRSSAAGYQRRHGAKDSVSTGEASVLLDKIAKRIQEPQVLHLVKQIIKASGRMGVPQGGPFSPLAANIYLNEVGYCLMAGGSQQAAERVASVLSALAPEKGYALVGANGAGHFVKMVHNGIE